MEVKYLLEINFKCKSTLVVSDFTKQALDGKIGLVKQIQYFEFHRPRAAFAGVFNILPSKTEPSCFYAAMSK
jgi:hypothetical protein